MTNRDQCREPVDDLSRGKPARFWITSSQGSSGRSLSIAVVDSSSRSNFPPVFHGQMLVFSGAPPLARVTSGVGLLEDFLKLGSATDEAYTRIRAGDGSLVACPAHCLPWQHDPNVTQRG